MIRQATHDSWSRTWGRAGLDKHCIPAKLIRSRVRTLDDMTILCKDFVHSGIRLGLGISTMKRKPAFEDP